MSAQTSELIQKREKCLKALKEALAKKVEAQKVVDELQAKIAKIEKHLSE